MVHIDYGSVSFWVFFTFIFLIGKYKFILTIIEDHWMLFWIILKYNVIFWRFCLWHCLLTFFDCQWLLQFHVFFSKNRLLFTFLPPPLSSFFLSFSSFLLFPSFLFSSVLSSSFVRSFLSLVFFFFSVLFKYVFKQQAKKKIWQMKHYWTTHW